MSEEEQFRWPDNWDVALSAIRRCIQVVGQSHGVKQHDIEDLYQAVCLRVLAEATATLKKQKDTSFENLRLFCAWIKTVAKNVIYQQWRKTGRPVPAHPGVTSPAPLADDWFEEYVVLVEGELEQEALRLRAQAESFRSIARILRVSLPQAHVLVRRAYAQLKARSI